MWPYMVGTEPAYSCDSCDALPSRGLEKLVRTGGWRSGSDAERNLNHRWFTRELTEQLPKEDRSGAVTRLNDSLAYSIIVARCHESSESKIATLWRIRLKRACRFSTIDSCPWRLAASQTGGCAVRGTNLYYGKRCEDAFRSLCEPVWTRWDFPFPPTNGWPALYEPILDLVTSRGARERGIYNVDAIIGDVRRHRRGEVRLGDAIFDVAQFEIWSAL